MKKYGLLIATALLFLGSQAQTKKHILKGQVKDINGKSITQAKVMNQSDTTEFVFSDASGLFMLETNEKVQTMLIRKSGLKVESLNPAASFVHVVMRNGQKDVIRKREDVVIECDMSVMDQKESMYEIQATSQAKRSAPMGNVMMIAPEGNYVQNSESYSAINENGYHLAKSEPLSTFSIDVDRASYSNVRRFINNGQLPPADAVRIEEMINYFNYNYDAPKGSDPVAIYTEVSQAPWNKEHQLLHIGIKAKDLDRDKLPASSLVFLIDVSGSMNSVNKLPLLKSSMKMLVQQMTDEDKVAIVVYAGAAGLVLEPTSGSDKQKIYNAIDNLSAGGSTAGGAGIKLAYQVALENLIKNGNNRVILATDGDFNVGASSDQEMEKLIESKRNQGVFLTVLGFGMGNYKDSKMEVLADKGNGNYAYIDNITEAKKTLVNEFAGTMFAVAKDVKIQVEFNPANVAEYRLIGYENRLLNKEDFNNDKKDAGEMGVGHVVTALYEIVPFGSSSNRVDPLKYQKQDQLEKVAILSDELVTVKLRYKEPDSDKSKLISSVVHKNEKTIEKASENLRWSASMAGFGMLLRDSEFLNDFKYSSVISLAESATGSDKEGYRRESVQLMKSAELLEKSNTASR